MAAVTLLAATVWACGSSTPVDVPDSWQAIDQEASDYQSTQGLPGLSVAVVMGGDVQFARGYGFADVELQRPVTPSTLFPIGSIEKQFTAAAILKLVESGTLRLEDPITDYLPRLDTAGHVVTLADMLNQVSGLQELSTLEASRDLAADQVWGPVADENVGRGFKSAEDIAPFDGQPLYFPPRTRFSYSQPNYDLLCYVIARVTGATYYDAIQRVAEAAGLRSFYPFWTPRPSLEDPNVAQGYSLEQDGLEVAWEPNLGSAWATAVELASWSSALEHGEVVSPESYSRMSAPVQLENGSSWPYGFGLVVGELAGRPRVSHTGRVLGFYAAMTSYPENDLTIVLMTNLGGASGLAYDLEPSIARHILGIAGTEVLDLPLTPEEQNRFTGSYDAGAYSFDVLARGERVELLMRESGGTEEAAVYHRGMLRYQGDGQFVEPGAPEWREITFMPSQGVARTMAVGAFAQAVRPVRLEASLDGERPR